MITDLSRKTVELDELLEQYWNAAYAEGREGRNHDTENADAQRILIEIHAAVGRRLKEAQQRNAAHDAEVAAEALEERADVYDAEPYPESEYYAIDLRAKAAEYRAKATKVGRKG